MSQIRVSILIQAIRDAFDQMSSERGWYQDLDITKTGAGSIMSRYKKGTLSIEKMAELLEAKEIMIDFKNSFANPNISLGKHMIAFNHRSPEVDREILYLLGDGLTGISQTCQLVRGIYDPTFGDFSRDDKGNYEYVTYWMPINSQS